MSPNSNPISRLDPKHNIALMASAGTGKTFNLALRVVTTLMKGNEADLTGPVGGGIVGSIFSPAGKILCLTFTRKATAEMAERVHKYLTKLANGQFTPDDPEFKAVQSVMPDMTHAEISKTAAKVLNRVYSDPTVLQIRTIDSFVASIMRLFPFETDTSPDFDIFGNHQNILFQKKAFEKAFKALPDNRNYIDLFFRFIALSGEQPYIFTNRVKKYVNFIIERSVLFKEHLFEASQLTPDTLIQETISAEAILKETAGTLLQIVDYLKPRLDKLKIKDKLLNDLHRYAQNLDYKNIYKNIQRVRPEVLVKAGQKMSDEYIRLYAQVQTLLENFITVFEELDVAILMHLAGYLHRVEEQLKKQLNTLSYADMSRMVHNILNDEDGVAPDYLYFRLDGRIEHILVDEFQDTSLIQWRILKPLVDEALSGLSQHDKIGSFFCVGDSKQTIYRFRGSNPGFFQNVAGEYAGRLMPDYLEINHRSDRNILEFVNNFFENANALIAKEEPDKEYFKYTRQQAHSREDGYVCLKTVYGNNAGERAAKRQMMLEEIYRELQQAGWEDEDMAILVSKRASGLAAHNFLSSRGIDSYMGFLDDLSARPAFEIIRALLNYMIDGSLYWLAAFLFTEPSVVPLSRYTQPDILYKYKKLLDARLKETENMSVYDRILNLGYKLSLLRRLSGNPDFPVILTAIAENIPAVTNVRSFLSSIESLASRQNVSSKGKGISIMTVHGAKGLQYPVVILFDVKDSASLSTKVEYFISENNDRPRLHKRLNKHMESFAGEVYKTAATRERTMDLYEKINKLYVASTRAEHVLYVLTEKDSPNTTDTFIQNSFPHGLELGELPVKAKDKKRKKQSLTKDELSFYELCRQTIGAINLKPGGDPGQTARRLEEIFDKTGYHQIIADRFLSYTRKALETKPEIFTVELHESFQNRQFGIAMHEALYQLEILKDSIITKDAVNKAANKACIRYGGYLDTHAQNAVAGYLELLANDDEWLELIKGGEVHREKALFHEGQLVIIDTYIKKDSSVTVADFKTGDPRGHRLEEYKEQISRYKKALAAKYGLETRGVLVYLHHTVEIVEV